MPPRSTRIDRSKALEKLQNGEFLTQYDVDLLEVMPTQRKKLKEHLDRQKNGEIVQGEAPVMHEEVPSETPNGVGRAGASGTVSNVDEAMFQHWVSSLPLPVQAIITRQVDEPPTARFSHRVAQMLAANGSSDKDIATLLGVEKSQLQAEAKGALELGRTQYRFMLNQRQLWAALAGDRTILTLLGKHKLGQNDKGEGGTAGSSAEQHDAIKRTKEKLSRLIVEAKKIDGSHS